MIRRRRVVLLAVPATVLVVLGLWAFWLEPASLRTASYRLSIPSWPDACAGTRVALLADLHVGSPFNGLEKLGRIVDRVRAAQPHLVLLAGDFVIHGVPGGAFVSPPAIASTLARLQAPLGVFAVLGNHDWWHDPTAVRAALEARGITLLEDEAVALSSGSCRFWLAGMSDYREARHDVQAALRPVPPAAPILAFTHNPDLFPDIPGAVSLTMAGHTHGGQVYLPLVGRPIVPSRYGQRFAIGHIVEGGRHLFVTPGLGTSILPVRFLVPPEVSVLELHPG